MKVTLNRPALVSSNMNADPAGTVCEVDDVRGKEMIRNGVAREGGGGDGETRQALDYHAAARVTVQAAGSMQPVPALADAVKQRADIENKMIEGGYQNKAAAPATGAPGASASTATGQPAPGSEDGSLAASTGGGQQSHAEAQAQAAQRQPGATAAPAAKTSSKPAAAAARGGKGR